MVSWKEQGFRSCPLSHDKMYRRSYVRCVIATKIEQAHCVLTARLQLSAIEVYTHRISVVLCGYCVPIIPESESNSKLPWGNATTLFESVASRKLTSLMAVEAMSSFLNGTLCF